MNQDNSAASIPLEYDDPRVVELPITDHIVRV